MFSYPRINIGFIVLSIFLGIVFALLRIFSVFTDFTAFIGVLLVFAITCLASIIVAAVITAERDRFNFYDRERNRDSRFIFGRCGTSLLGFALAAVFSSAVFLLVRGNTFTEGLFILFSVFADTYLALGLFSCLRRMTGNACGAFNDNDRAFTVSQPETDERYSENRYEDTLGYQENYRGNDWEDYRDNKNYRGSRRQEDSRDNRRENYRDNRREENYQDDSYRDNGRENYRDNRQEEDHRDSRRRNSSSRNSSRNNRR